VAGVASDWRFAVGKILAGREINGYGVSLWTFGGHLRSAVARRSVIRRFAVDLLEVLPHG
jgi:hypothetical protein